MTVAPPESQVRLCSRCGKVPPAQGLRDCTMDRALTILEFGFCMCPPEDALSSLAPQTRELYRELIELSQQPQEAQEPSRDSNTTLDGIVRPAGLVPQDEDPTGPFEVSAPFEAILVRRSDDPKAVVLFGRTHEDDSFVPIIHGGGFRPLSANPPPRFALPCSDMEENEEG